MRRGRRVPRSPSEPEISEIVRVSRRWFSFWRILVFIGAGLAVLISMVVVLLFDIFY